MKIQIPGQAYDIKHYTKAYKAFNKAAERINSKKYDAKFLLDTLNILSDALNFYKEGTPTFQAINNMHREIRRVYVDIFRNNY